jgi:hypothetical protein
MPYQRTISAYCEIYGVSQSTVKMWKRLGHPLDDEAAMQPIIDAMRTRRNVSKYSKKQEAKLVPAVVLAPIQISEGTGLAAAIQRFREAELAAAKNYAQAQDQATLTHWILLTDQLRKIEKDNPEILKSNEKTLDADKVEAEWSAQINEFRAALEAIPQRMAIILEGLDAIAIQEKLAQEVRQVMRVFTEAS